MIYILDAHTLVWYLSGSGRLPRRIRQLIDHIITFPNQVVVPTVVLAEAWDMARKERGDYAPFSDIVGFINDNDVDTSVISHALLERLNRPELDALKSQPALWNDMHDMIVLGTALLRQDAGESVAIISGDGEIGQQRFVPCIW